MGEGAIRVWGDELAGLHYRDNMSMCRKKRCKLLTYLDKRKKLKFEDRQVMIRGEIKPGQVNH